MIITIRSTIKLHAVSLFMIMIQHDIGVSPYSYILMIRANGSETGHVCHCQVLPSQSEIQRVSDRLAILQDGRALPCQVKSLRMIRMMRLWPPDLVQQCPACVTLAVFSHPMHVPTCANMCQLWIWLWGVCWTSTACQIAWECWFITTSSQRQHATHLLWNTFECFWKSNKLV